MKKNLVLPDIDRVNMTVGNEWSPDLEGLYALEVALRMLDSSQYKRYKYVLELLIENPSATRKKLESTVYIYNEDDLYDLIYHIDSVYHFTSRSSVGLHRRTAERYASKYTKLTSTAEYEFFFDELQSLANSYTFSTKGDSDFFEVRDVIMADKLINMVGMSPKNRMDIKLARKK